MATPALFKQNKALFTRMLLAAFFLSPLTVDAGKTPPPLEVDDVTFGWKAPHAFSGDPACYPGSPVSASSSATATPPFHSPILQSLPSSPPSHPAVLPAPEMPAIYSPIRTTIGHIPDFPEITADNVQKLIDDANALGLNKKILRDIKRWVDAKITDIRSRDYTFETYPDGEYRYHELFEINGRLELYF